MHTLTVVSKKYDSEIIAFNVSSSVLTSEEYHAKNISNFGSNKPISMKIWENILENIYF